MFSPTSPQMTYHFTSHAFVFESEHGDSFWLWTVWPHENLQGSVTSKTSLTNTTLLILYEHDSDVSYTR